MTDETRRARIAFLLVAALAIALFASSLLGQFTFDDARGVLGHPGVVGRFSPSAIFGLGSWGHAFGDPLAPGTYRPLVTLTYWIDWHLASGKPWPFHLTNVLLFVLVLFVADRFLRRWATDLSLAARALALAAFAALTLHVDVVPSITGRTELMAMLFSLLALDRAARSTHPPRDLVLFAITLAAALLCKESTLPIAVLAVVLAARSGAPRRSVATIAAVAITLVIALIVFRHGRLAFRTEGENWAFDNPLQGWSTAARLGGAMQALTHYLGHTFAPFDLCPDYSYAAASPVPGVGLRVVVGASLVLLSVASLALTWRSLPRLADALLGFGASYLVMSHLLVPGSAFVADRVFFFPSFWLVLALAIAIDHHARVPRHRTLAGVATALAVAGQALITAIAVPVWRNDATLTAYAVRACPTGFRLRLMRAGSATASQDAPEAAWSLLMACAIFRHFPSPLDEGTFDGAWEDLPIARRVANLRQKVGDREFESLRGAARRLALSRQDAAAERALRGW